MPAGLSWMPVAPPRYSWPAEYSPVRPHPHLPAWLTHTSTMMTMSLGDEAPWMYLSGRSLSQGHPHWDLVGPSFLLSHGSSACLY